MFLAECREAFNGIHELKVSKKLIVLWNQF